MRIELLDGSIKNVACWCRYLLGFRIRSRGKTMKIKVFTVYGRYEIFDISDYETGSDGILSLFLTNGSFVQYSPYDWLCIVVLRGKEDKIGD